MQRRSFLACAGAVPFVAGIGCSRKKAKPVRKLRVAALQYYGLSPLYLAQELGHFREAGLEVEIQSMPDPSGAVPLLAAGRLDAALFSANPAVINGVAQGAAIRIVAGRHVASPTCGEFGAIYGRQEVFPAGLANLRVLEHKRVAISGKATVAEFALDAVLSTVGMSSEDVAVVTLTYAAALTALASKKIDALSSAIHFGKDPSAVVSQLVRGIGLAQVYPNHQYSHVFFGETLLRDRSMGASFLAAYLEGVRDFLAGRTPRFLEDLARSDGLDLDTLRNGCRNIMTPDGSIDLASLQRLLQWCTRKGYCQRKVPPEQLIDTAFLEEAHRNMGRRR